MADASPTKSGWSDAEKVSLLVEIAIQNGTPNWKTLKLPPGRTQKACMHVWGKMKEIASNASGPTTPTTPTKSAGKGKGDDGGGGAGKKRKANDDGATKRDKKSKVQDDNDDDEEVEPKIKHEDDEMMENADDSA